MGLAFGCVSGPSLLNNLESTALAAWLSVVFVAAASGTMLSGIANDDVSVVLTCLC